MGVDTVKDAYYADENDEVSAFLLQAMKRANLAIYQANQSKNPPPEKSKIMGTTCVAAVNIADTVYVAEIGGSRAYIVRGEQVGQLSQEYSMDAVSDHPSFLPTTHAREIPQHK